MNKAKSFHHKGHDYTVAPIENSEQYVATRDNRNVAYTDDINLYISTEFDEVRDQIAQLFTTKKITTTMNNDNKQQRLDKLTSEYNDLNGKIARLDAFLNRLDFETIVPDREEQMLMQHQLNAMRSYRGNLKERIQLLQAQIQAGSPCDDSVVTSATHHCGQDASCPVGDGSAVVNEVPDSIKSLEGMQVIKVCGPKCKDCPCGDGLREYPSGRDMSSCVKIELVGGYTLCLSLLPNSIVTE